MKRLRILLDMDCVLADFIAGACAAHGVPLSEFERATVRGEYGMNAGLARAKHPMGHPLTHEEFWRPINATPGFWEALPVLPWALELIDLVNRFSGGDYYFVTAPSECRDCVAEKRRWLKKIDQDNSRMIPTPHKELFAVTQRGPAILIDDHEANCERFETAGGVPLLFPALHNGLHYVEKAVYIQHVTELLAFYNR